MATEYNDTFKVQPTAGVWVIIRMPYQYGAPIRAKYVTSTSPRQFRVDNLAALAIPFYMVPRWKYE